MAGYCVEGSFLFLLFFSWKPNGDIELDARVRVRFSRGRSTTEAEGRDHG